MNQFTKVTEGVVVQTFEKNEDGNFVCVGQRFAAWDVVVYEDADGNCIAEPDYMYQPYKMVL